MFCFYMCKLVSTSDYDAAVASSPQFGALYLVFFPNQICFRAYYLPLIHLSTNQKIQQIRSQPIRRNGTFNVIFTLAYLFKSIPLFIQYSWLHPMYRRQAAPHNGVFVVRNHWRLWPLFYLLAVLSVYVSRAGLDCPKTGAPVRGNVDTRFLSPSPVQWRGAAQHDCLFSCVF